MPVRTVGWRHILWRTIVGDIKHAATRPQEFKYQVLRESWLVAKRFGAHGISGIELRQIEGLGEKPMTGYFDAAEWPQDAPRTALAIISTQAAVAGRGSP